MKANVLETIKSGIGEGAMKHEMMRDAHTTDRRMERKTESERERALHERTGRAALDSEADRD